MDVNPKVTRQESVDFYDRRKSNEEVLERLKRENKNMTHVYIKRWGMDGSIIDVPLNSVAMTLKVNKMWEIVSSNKQMSEEVEKLFEDETASIPSLSLSMPTVAVDNLEVPAAPSQEEILAALESLQDAPGQEIEPETVEIAIGDKITIREAIGVGALTPTVGINKCPKCDFVGKNSNGLRLHSKKHAK